MLVVELERDGTRLISRCGIISAILSRSKYFHRSLPIVVSFVSSTGRERELPPGGVSSKYLSFGWIPAPKAAPVRETLNITWDSINDGALSLAP